MDYLWSLTNHSLSSYIYSREDKHKITEEMFFSSYNLVAFALFIH